MKNINSTTGPTVSVLLPVHNGGLEFEAAIDSIVNQTFSDFELLIIDDGSTDSSLIMAKSFAARDKRIKVISRENRGLIPTLNQLVAVASGKYLARMDADDIAHTERLARQVAFLESHPEVVCLGGAQQLIDEKGRFLTYIYPPTDNDTIQDAILVGHGAICHPTAMMRAEAIQKIGGYDPIMQYCEDLDLWLRLGETGELANLPEVVLKYRLSTNSVSALNGQAQRRNGRRACEAAWTRRGLSGMSYNASEPWRPDGTPENNCRFLLKYGWWAFGSGERRTALVYALRASRECPKNVEAYRLAYCAIFKLPKVESVQHR